MSSLLGLLLILRPSRSFTVPPQYTTGLHSWFLNQVRLTHPALSQYMHDGQSEKPFTLSGLLDGTLISQSVDPSGDLRSNRQLLLPSNQTYSWIITGLNPEVTHWLQTWQIPSTVKLQSDTLEIEAHRILYPATTYETLWNTFHNTPRTPQDLCFTFLTPTSFRHHGNHLPLPLPDIIFQSYLRRWNCFAPIEFNKHDFKQWVNEHIVIARHKIESSKVQAGKQGSVTGFTGCVQFHLTSKAQSEPDYVQLIYALEQLAPYCGTGHKTTFGLGQTRLGWNLPTESAPLAQVAPPAKPPLFPPPTKRLNPLQRRITELTEQFIATKKRQGGERARQSAETWATILAHRESGESITNIAANLDMNYETVKKYYTLANRALKALEDAENP
jgi:CRISPR-associated endoribonuclease Cas6